MCSRQGAIQIHVYLTYLPYPVNSEPKLECCMWQIEPLSQHAVVFPTASQLAARYQINCLVTGAGAVGCKKLHWFDVPQCVTCKPTTSILSLLQHDKLQLTCIFVCQPSCLELTSWKCAGVNTYGHLQATLQDIFILADDTLSTLETILSNSNSNSNKLAWGFYPATLQLKVEPTSYLLQDQSNILSGTITPLSYGATAH